MPARKPGSPSLAVTISQFFGTNPRVRAEDTYSWPAFHAFVQAILKSEHTDKEQLPGFTTCAFDGGYRSNAAAGEHTALVIDVDRCDADALLSACEQYRTLVYETPSSTDDLPRFRVVAALTQPIPAYAVPWARRELAKALGLDPATCGVTGAQDPARYFYLGRITGTRARLCVAYQEGPNGKVWAPAQLPAEADVDGPELTPTEPYRDSASVPDISCLTPHFAPAGHSDDRHPVVRAIGGWLAKKGFHPDSIGEAVELCVPTDKPRQRSREASDAARRHYSGEVTPGWDVLVARFGESVMAEAEAAVSDPWVEALTARWAARAVTAPLAAPAPVANSKVTAPSDADALASLPPWVQAHASAVQEELRTPLALNVANALGALACAVSGRLRVRIHGSYTAYTCLFVCGVADPGENKSSAFNRALGPVTEWEQERMRDDAVRFTQAKSDRLDLEAKLKVLETERKRGYASDEIPEADPELLGLRIKLAEPPPVPFRYIVGDVTSEKLADMLAQHGRLVCLSSDAGKIFSVLGGQYSGGSADLSVWLEAYDGRAAPVDRMGREAERPRHDVTALSAALSTQPSVLESLTGNAAMSGQGFVHRFCWVLGDSIERRWAPGERVKPVPESVQSAYDTHIRTMLALPNDSECPLSPEAESAYIAWRDELEVRKSIDLGGEMKAWGGKHLERTTRIAALLWAADGAQGPVTGEQMARAVVLGRWLVPHAQRALGADTDELDVKLVRCIAKAVERLGRPVTIRDLTLPRALKRNAKDRDSRLANLEAIGKLAKSGRGWLPA